MDVLSGDRKIVVWGQGDFGKMFVKSLLKCGFSVDIIIDSNPKGPCLNIPVVPFDVKSVENKRIIIATSRYEEEIIHILRDNSINMENVIPFSKIRKKVIDYLDDKDEVVSHMIDLTGINLLEELCLRIEGIE